MNRRRVLTGGGLVIGATVIAAVVRGLRNPDDATDEGDTGVPQHAPAVKKMVGSMPYRVFGRSGVLISEIGFGSWATGGTAYGAVEKQDSLRALARAEELGCNLVDTAMIYGDSELVLGEFLRGRRSKWLIATKYSGQPIGMTATLEMQLQRLKTDSVDLYQLHSVPGPDHQALYAELEQLKRAGKTRLTGVSVYSRRDVDRVLAHPEIDGLQLAFSLLDPDPFLARVQRLRASGRGILVRSALKEGFLTGKFKRDAQFTDTNDQRHSWTREQIESTVDQVERFRFLEREAGSMIQAAARYPLSFPEVSSVLLGTKNEVQADFDFGKVPGGRLSKESLARIRALQQELGLRSRREAIYRLVHRFTGLNLAAP